ncbi:MspA family porin [Nocardia sp. NBC_00565]|uniref:MspA family porin n=1 Tax=Nocardia sp. NBC_00565 TaxID=2975993 RepID=UPI002E811B36|nr:MspA family porin [Nocardia sp. NBC_00565]WUC02972.1 MspA family porin [Nocardia sp. NBC_00565]
MNIKSVLAIAATLTGVVLAGAPFANAQGMAPHEKNYSGPAGFELTVGHMDEQFRPVPPLNGMPTNREVFLDDTFYATVPANATGTLKAGYLIACAVEVKLAVDIDAGIGFDAGFSIGVSGSGDSVSPNLNASLGPTIHAGIGFDLSLAPGEIRPIEVGTKQLAPGSTSYLVSHDYHLLVKNCGGPLTIQSYVTVTAESPEVSVGDAVTGDRIFL